MRIVQRLQLSTDVLGWAAAKVGASVEELAQKISKRDPDKIARGELSTAQAIEFSKLAGVPFGYLFLDEPPADRTAPLVDFRTLSHPTPLSKDFFQTYDDIEYKQAWYRQYLENEQADPLPFVGRFTEGTAPTAIAADIRKTLAISDEEVYSQKSPDDLYAFLALKAEAAGILVFKNSVVGNNTRRSLSVSEFRGFVISDKFAPAIFINGADAPAAWVFTLAHELAHVWLGESGVSDTSPNSQNNHERLCNAVAAELIIPADTFTKLWDEIDGSDEAKVTFVRRHIKVSALVIARRALELGKVSKVFYESVYTRTRDAAKKAGRADFYRTFAVRNSKTFANCVATLAARGAISFREAGNLLNTNPNNVMTYYAQQHPLSH